MKSVLKTIPVLMFSGGTNAYHISTCHPSQIVPDNIDGLNISSDADLRGLLCGDVICCYHSSETGATEGGCGNTDECLKCQIRVTINKAFKSTNDQKSVPAWISKCKEKRDIVNSVYWKRDDAVLLVIDEIGEQK